MIFPGQGSQFVGMGKDLVERFPRVKALYEEADETLGYPLSRLCFAGNPDVLTETRNAQPAILLHSVAAARVLREEGGIEPAIVAGHSLGEYSALVVAGVLSPMDALMIVRKRGELMFEAGLVRPGTMAAVIGLDTAEVEAACAEASRGEAVVVIANINSPGQIVISGHIEAVGRGMARCSERGAKKVVPLTVSGAFHSPLVRPAQQELVRYFGNFLFEDAGIGIVCNVDATVIHRKGEIIDALSRQLTSPVRWSDSMKVLLGKWGGEIIETGPGGVLAGLMRRIDRTRRVRTAGSTGELEGIIAPLTEPA
jgi:[acyl-carrier-protein] S-malonyltransferase